MLRSESSADVPAPGCAVFPETCPPPTGRSLLSRWPQGSGLEVGLSLPAPVHGKAKNWFTGARTGYFSLTMGFLTNRLGWVPNLFTLGNLWLGFFSILLSLQNIGNPDLLRVAGGLIILAVLCDGLDGFAARLLNAQSEVGAQLDSLADLTTFGIAPAALMYSLSMSDLLIPVNDRLSLPAGMILAGLYPACAAFRLARFNVAHDDDHFIGLPSPVAGLIIALMPLAFQETLLIPAPILIGVYVACAYLMVSTLRYSKVQVTMVRRFSPIRMALVVLFLIGVLIFLGIRYGGDFSAAGLFAIIILYIVSGLVTFILHLIQELRV